MKTLMWLWVMSGQKHFSKKVGKRLRTARISAGYDTLASFADKYHFPRSTYNQYEIGDRLPGLEIFEKMARLLHTNVLWLLTGKGDARLTDSDLIHLSKKEGNTPKLLSEEEFLSIVSQGKQKIRKTNEDLVKTKNHSLDPALLTAIFTQVSDMLKAIEGDVNLPKLSSLSASIYSDLMKLYPNDNNKLDLLNALTSAFKRYFSEHKKVSNF